MAQGEERTTRWLRPKPDVVARRLGDEIAVVHLDSGRIFKLNSTGARFWELASEGHDRASIERRLLDEFDVRPEQLAGEVTSLVQQLTEAGLVETGE